MSNSKKKGKDGLIARLTNCEKTLTIYIDEYL